jgi:hypothetical protein
MRVHSFVNTVLGWMLGLAPLPSMAQLCTAHIDQWTGKCAGGCSGFYAYKATCYGCNTCVLCGGCIPLGPQGAAAEKATDAQSLPVVLATGEMLAIPDAGIRRIAVANPWIAASIIALREMGSNAVLAFGDAHFSRGPTEASIAYMLDGGVDPVEVDHSMLPFPEGTHTRTTWRLERGPGPDDQLLMSSGVIDPSGRLLYRVYPDIALTLAEASTDEQPTKGHGDEGGMDRMKPVPAGQRLRLRSWTVAE